MVEQVRTGAAPLAPAERIASFAEFWPYYLSAHKKPLNRALHYCGTSSAVGFVAFVALTGHWSWLLAAPVIGYGPAWIGHFLVEGNRPATFGHARYSLMADFKMLGLALRGRMSDELDRVLDTDVRREPAPHR
jgi:hypothetical protein